MGGNGEASAKQVTNGGSQKYQYRNNCGKCGATRIDKQIGLEKTPEEYVAKIVAVFREVRRVLRDDGTVWLNLGSSYASNPAKGGSGPNGKNTDEMGYGRPMRQGSGRADGIVTDESPRNRDGCSVPPGFKPKDMVPIPWMVAMSLQRDGWWLRSDIIWSKPNPMPESVTDRPTKAHEYIFLLAKSEKYYFDQDAVREDGAGRFQEISYHRVDHPKNEFIPHERYLDQYDTGRIWGNPAGRNIRTVWEIATQPYPEAHFATFPEELAKRCILAGCPVGGVVLDPFAGSGTVGQVALELGRRAVLIELNEDYCKLIDRRTRVTYGMQF